MIDAILTLDNEVLRVAAAWDRWAHGADRYWREGGTLYLRRLAQVYRLAYLEADSVAEWVRVPVRGFL